VSAAAKLGAFLKPAEAKRLADAWKQTPGLLHVVVKAVDAPRRNDAAGLLQALCDDVQQEPAAVLAVLQAVASVPSLPGIEGHTTLAIASLINEAQDVVYAATYSATLGSAYVTALSRAVARGVKVTLILDHAQQAKAAQALASSLMGARLWTLAPPEGGEYAVQHAKLVMVDRSAALVTSANFSEAAAERNLECGVLLRDRRIAESVREHLDMLYRSNYLVDYTG
jgi:phosphatidylserine/phosphatidylglycerophosphate/cardiolipin synthase-like enzyme